MIWLKGEVQQFLLGAVKCVLGGTMAPDGGCSAGEQDARGGLWAVGCAEVGY